MGQLVFQATLGGQVNLVGPNTASTFNLNVPAVAGNLITSGDSATVTNTMLAGSIANAKLLNSSVTVGSTSIALGATSTTLDGVNIGATTAGTGAFTTLSASSTVSGTGFSTYLASPPAIGGTAAAAGAFTTLSASSTVSGTGFSTYLASPPAIGGTAAAAGTFTTLTGSTSVTTPIVKSASSLTLQSNGTTTAVTIDTSQNVGIGTASPTQKLTVAGQMLSIASSGASFKNITPTTGNNYMWLGNTGNNLYVGKESSAGGTLFVGASAYAAVIGNDGVYPLQFATNNTVQATIDSSGNLLVGMTSGSSHTIGKSGTYTTTVLQVGTNGDSYTGTAFFGINNVGWTSANAAAAPFKVGSSTTSRSINAAGTVNVSGLDYAEYMTKAGDFTIAKGDVVGIDNQGKLTNVFANAVSFVVKSTDPSYVGGDTWGGENKIGKRPEPDAPQEEQDAFEAALEAARQTVDRISFSGQVPVNVTGATAGQYIIPVNDNGAIKGEAVSNPTFEQYQISVGKVIAIESDGRAKIIVKVA